MAWSPRRPATGGVPQPAEATPAKRFERASLVLRQLVKACEEGAPWLLASSVRALLGHDAAIAQDIGDLLEHSGTIRRLFPPSFDIEQGDVWDECWVPAVRMDQLNQAALFRAVWVTAPGRCPANTRIRYRPWRVACWNPALRWWRLKSAPVLSLLSERLER